MTPTPQHNHGRNGRTERSGNGRSEPDIKFGRRILGQIKILPLCSKFELSLLKIVRKHLQGQMKSLPVCSTLKSKLHVENCPTLEPSAWRDYKVVVCVFNTALFQLPANEKRSQLSPANQRPLCLFPTNEKALRVREGRRLVEMLLQLR